MVFLLFWTRTMSMDCLNKKCDSIFFIKFIRLLKLLHKSYHISIYLFFLFQNLAKKHDAWWEFCHFCTLLLLGNFLDFTLHNRKSYHRYFIFAKCTFILVSYLFVLGFGINESKYIAEPNMLPIYSMYLVILFVTNQCNVLRCLWVLKKKLL